MRSSLENSLNTFSKNTTTSNPANTDRVEFRISAAAAQGGRRYMEDRIHIAVKRNKEGKLDHIFAGVYDGHGGPQASQYVCKNLYENICKAKGFDSSYDNDVLGAIHCGFINTHNNMHKVLDQWPSTDSGYPCTAGTTASCVLIRDGKLFTGHVGDSFVMLVNFSEDEHGYDDAKLTIDHRPDNEKERLRIIQSGGNVATQMGCSRVVWNRSTQADGPIRRSSTTQSIPFLAVARSLGDFWSLNSERNVFVVSPSPDVDVFQLKDSDKFIVIASDGVSNVMGTKAIVNLLKHLNIRENASKNSPFQKTTGRAYNYAHHILNSSFARWGSLRADNISTITIELVELSEDKCHDFSNRLFDNPQMDVNEELCKFPTSVIRVDRDTNCRLNTNAPKLVYAGPRERSRQLQSKGNTSKLDDESRESDDAGFFFEGPGFVVPQSPPPESNNTSDLDDSTFSPIGLRSIHNYLHPIFDDSGSKDRKRRSGKKRRSMSVVGAESVQFSKNHMFGSNIKNKYLSTAVLNTLDFSATDERFSSTSHRSNFPSSSKNDICPLLNTAKSFGGIRGLFSSAIYTNNWNGSSSSCNSQHSQGVKRRHFEEQSDESDSDEKNRKVCDANQPPKKRKRQIEKILSQVSHSGQYLFGSKKSKPENSHVETASIPNTSLPMSNEDFSDSEQKPQKHEEAGRGPWKIINYLSSFFFKPFNSPKRAQ